MKLPRILRVLLAVVALVGLTGYEAHTHPKRPVWPPRAPGFEYLGALHLPAVAELSGLARSHREPRLYWGINDSGNPAALTALDPGRGVRGVVSVEGVANVDWEEVASFEEDGRPWLAIADAGDNFALRGHVQVILVPEPEPGAASVAPARILRFTYEDGPRDVEAVAVDIAQRRLLLADKGQHPPGLYELPLDGADEGRVAKRIASFPDLIPTPAPRVLPIGARWRGTPTALTLSADGRRMVVLTYESIDVFDRRDGETWAQALGRPAAARVRVPPIQLLESVVLDADERSAVIATEGPWAHFYRWQDVPPR